MLPPQPPGPERELPPLADMFRAFSGSTPLGLYLVLDGVFAWTNPQFERNTGYSLAELVGRSPLDLVHPDDRAQVRQHAVEMLKGAHQRPYHYRCIGRDGGIRWIVETVAPVPWGDRRATIGNFLDVTARVHDGRERQQVEQQRNQALGELQAVFDASSDGIALIAPDLRVVRVNSRFSELLGVSANEVMGLRLVDVEAIVRRGFADPDVVLRWIAEDSHDGDEQTNTMTFAQLWPEARELEVRRSSVRSADGGALGQLYTVRDVTQDRAVSRMKTEFVSLVSHELRTPLTSIKGYADLLIDGEVGELTGEQREFTGIIKTNADRLVSLVNDLLDVSRIEAGRVELRLAPVDVRRAIEAVATLLGPQLDAKAQRLSLRFAPGLPMVQADADRLTQILLNLLSNAHKYTPAGGTVQVAAEPAGEWVVVAVHDSGIGLSPAEQSQLFTKFFRAANPVVQAAGGTGLGLAITRALVELHGGVLSVRSTPGAGSTFSFTLPSAGGPLSIADAPLRGCVLVVDDEPDIAGLLRRYLERGGYQVLATGRGKDAIALARAERPDLIILDVMLPDQDGLTVVERLQADPDTAAIPVILLSILPDEGRGRLLGAVDYMQKPVAERDLLQRVGEQLEQARRLTGGAPRDRENR